jgi:hypothetical protein
MSGRLTAATLLAVAGSCTVPSSPEMTPTPSGSPAPRISPSFDIGRVIRQVHFAFRPDRDGYGGGDTAYSVHVTHGAIELTARSGTVESAPLRLETIGARRSRELSVELSSTRTDARAELEMDRGPFAEHLRNGTAGVEQSWSFATKPGGAGDLVLYVRADSLAYAATTSHGLHFADPVTALGFRYGGATWIDAMGARTQIGARWASGRIEIRVPAAVVEGSAFPAVIDPVISPELGIDQTIYGSALGFQGIPDVASDGTDYLVAWHDERNTSGAWIEQDIFATRVSAAGAVLDPAGIQLTIGRGILDSPKIAWDGSSYLVVWRRNITTSWFLLAARVAPDGTVPSKFGVSRSRTVRTSFDLAPGASSSLVVWVDSNSTTTGLDLFGARIANGGGVVDPADLVVVADTGAQITPAVAGLGSEFLITWVDNRNYATTGYDLYALRVDSNANAIGSEMTISGAAGDQVLQAAASDGSAYLVTWSDNQNAATNGYDLYAARVDSTGVVDPNGVALASTSDDELPSDLVADSAGSYYVVWQTDTRTATNVSGASVQTGGAALTTSAALAIASTAYGRYSPAIASNGAGHLVTWTDGRDSSTGANVYAVRVDGSGALLDANGIDVSTAFIGQHAPAIASNGSDYLVAWEDARAGSPNGAQNLDVWGARVDATGTVLDPSGIAIATAPLNQLEPKIASNGTDYLVVWHDYRNDGDNPTDTIPPSPADIYGARVTSAGTVEDPGGIAIATTTLDELRPSVASNGVDYFVAWQQDYASFSIAGSRVTAAGQVVDVPPISIASAGTGVALAWNGADYVAAWDGVSAARVTAAGTVLDTTPISIGAGYSPAIASSAMSSLVVWNAAAGPQLFGARVAQDGTLLDAAAIPVSGTASAKRSPTLAWDGSSYLVTWADQASGATTGRDIIGTYVSDTGDVLFPDAFAISATPGDENAPAVASVGGSALVAYEGTAFSVPRIAGRIVTPDACSTDSDCSAGAAPCLVGACVRGTCRDSVAAGSCYIAGACVTQGDTDPSSTCMVCAPAVSQLRFAPATNGTSCSDGNACTIGDTCQSGTCTSGAPVVCSAIDQCHDGGSCDSTTGLCSTPAKPDGAACDDGNACTSGETCQQGSCGSATMTITCVAQDACHVSGTCDPSTGTCSNPVVGDGTPCMGGTCQSGVCVPNVDAGVRDAPVPRDASIDAPRDAAIDAPADAARADARPADARGADSKLDAASSATVDAGKPDIAGGGCGCRAVGPDGSCWFFVIAWSFLRRRRAPVT